MKSLKNVILFVTFNLSWALQLQAQEYREQVQVLDECIREAIQLWQPPGLAVTVVRDKEVIFQKGDGTRLIGQDLPVDEHTLFVCASTTKAFTAAALAMLVDEGKVHWDDPLNINDKLKGNLEHWNYDTCLVTFDKKTYGEEFVTFRYNPSGKVEALELMGREFQFLLQKD